MRDANLPGGSPLACATAAFVVGTAAFAAYSRTLLPGVDFGDTGGFQAAVLWPETSARQAYPLYYALARPFVRALSASDPARGLNLFSALCAGAAAGLLSFVAGVVARSALAGAAAGLFLAFAYTFWTQAVIAEVYALHLALVAICLIALRAWAERPTTRRLGLFFAAYAISFGNHLSMLLLLAPFALFLLQVHPRRRELLRPSTIVFAAAVAALGALIYIPNFLFVWTHLDAPPGWSERIAAFWFDTTKADWREAMVLEVDRRVLHDRVAMWIWDARQQFGAIGLVAIAAGFIRLWFLSRPWAALIALAYAISTGFALTYNVGDPHVFFLPGHLLMAFVVAAAAAPLARRPRASVALAGLLIAYAAWRAWDTWPAADRHRDTRAEALVSRLTAGVDDRSAILLSGLEWQVENALLYVARFERRDLAWTRGRDVLLHLPFLVRDNRAIGRDIVLTAGAAADVLSAYGPLYELRQDPVPPAPPFSAAAARVPRGAPYVLSLLPATNDLPLDEDDFRAAFAALTGGQSADLDAAQYQVWAGIAGDRPTYYHASDRPFREAFRLVGDQFTVRMVGWLPQDVFRRGGFGHVLRGREPLLTIERGASLLVLDGPAGGTVTYAGGLYAPQPRFRIPVASPRQLAGTPGAMLGTAAPPG